MSDSEPYGGRLRSYFLQVDCASDLSEVVIVGNQVALEHLRDMIDGLLPRQAVGAHFHLDRTTGLDGNVSSLVVGKIQEGEGKPTP